MCIHMCTWMCTYICIYIIYINICIYIYIYSISYTWYMYICICEHSFEGLLPIVLEIVLDFCYSKRTVEPFCRSDVFDCCTEYPNVFNRYQRLEYNKGNIHFDQKFKISTSRIFSKWVCVSDKYNEHWRKIYFVYSILVPPMHILSRQSQKLWLNIWACKSLNPRRSLVKSFSTVGLWALYNFLGPTRICF